MSRIFFTSDNHFGHKNILNFKSDTRAGKDVDEMDRLMIAMWQGQVQPNDKVFMLGDVFFHPEKKACAIMDQLPGEKHLILGNHDKLIRRSSSVQSKFSSIETYKEITIEKQRVILFHFPIQEWNGFYHGSWHLYGHVHGEYVHPGKALDVGIDGPLATQKQMSPWSWDDVKRYINPRPISRVLRYSGISES